jgi:hypothetical protein
LDCLGHVERRQVVDGLEVEIRRARLL